MFLSVGAAGCRLGHGAACLQPRRQRLHRADRRAAPPLYNALLNKYYVDEGYDYVFTGRRKLGDVRLGVLGLGEASAWFDTHVIDGAVNDAAGSRVLMATISSWWDKWIIDGIGVNGPAILARMLSLSGAPIRMGPGAVVRAGHDRRLGRVRVLLRVSLRKL